MRCHEDACLLNPRCGKEGPGSSPLAMNQEALVWRLCCTLHGTAAPAQSAHHRHVLRYLDLAMCLSLHTKQESNMEGMLQIAIARLSGYVLHDRVTTRMAAEQTQFQCPRLPRARSCARSYVMPWMGTVQKHATCRTGCPRMGPGDQTQAPSLRSQRP